MVATSGGEAIPLTAESVSSSHPRWSPDGKYLAFLLGARGREEANLDFNRSGGEAQQLTDTIQDVSDFAWSPSSDRLVLVLQDPTPDELEAAHHKEAGKGADKKPKPKPRPWVIDRLHFKDDEIGYLDRRRTHLYVFSLGDHKMITKSLRAIMTTQRPHGRRTAGRSRLSATAPQDPDRNFNDNIWVVAADNTDQGKNLVRVTTGSGYGRRAGVVAGWEMDRVHQPARPQLFRVRHVSSRDRSSAAGRGKGSYAGTRSKCVFAALFPGRQMDLLHRRR